jgi:diguanylate cyclase
LEQSEEKIKAVQREIHRLQIESMLDGLTGVASRKLLENLLSRAGSAAQASSRPLSLLLVDVDCFRTFNDRYGHQTGDDVLRLVAMTIKRSIRSGDIVGRYGGMSLQSFSRTPHFGMRSGGLITSGKASQSAT